MKKIIDYTVVTAIDTANLVELVFEMIQEGWQPFGGVSLAYERNKVSLQGFERPPGSDVVGINNDFEHYAQALVKYKGRFGG